MPYTSLLSENLTIMTDRPRPDVPQTPEEEQPNVGTDPMSQPQEGRRKKIVAPDPEKVKDAERKRAGDDA